MGKQCVVLKDHADTSLFRRHALPATTDDDAVDGDLSTGNVFKTGNAAQQCGLAAARGAKQASNLPGFYAQIHPIDDGGFAVTLNNAF